MSCWVRWTLVIPVWKEGSVGDRKVYAHALAFLNNMMWTLYASTDLPSKLLLFIVSVMGIVLHAFYTNFYIYFAEGKNRVQAMFILLAFCAVAFIMAVLVGWKVLITQMWSGTFINVMASISGASTQVVPAINMVGVAGSW